MKEVLLVKLGGSVITDKAGGGGIDNAALADIGKVFAAHNDRISVILVHGAGSYGHPEARSHHLDKGLDSNNKAGIFITHRAVRTLNDAVVNALRAQGMEAVGIHPLSACIADNGNLQSFDSEPVELLARNGIVPVLHGDVVMDRSRGACIVSGDQLVRCLAESLNVDRIGLATDVAGVLDGGAVVPHIDPVSASSLVIGESGTTDVTGGMRGKINELLTLAESGASSSIFHISRLGDFLDGRDHGGTVVTR